MAAAASLRPRRKRISAPQTIPRGRNAAATAIGACECCGRPRQLRISRGLLSKERAQPYRRGARRRVAKRGDRQGEPDRDQTERRRGRGASRGKTGARGGAQWATLATFRRRRRTRRRVARSRDLQSRPGREGRRGALAKPRSGRCGGCGSRTFANPPAGGRSAIREAETSPIAGSRRRKASPIAPAIAGWLTGRRREKG